MDVSFEGSASADGPVRLEIRYHCLQNGMQEKESDGKSAENGENDVAQSRQSQPRGLKRNRQERKEEEEAVPPVETVAPAVVRASIFAPSHWTVGPPVRARFLIYFFFSEYLRDTNSSLLLCSHAFRTVSTTK